MMLSPGFAVSSSTASTANPAMHEPAFATRIRDALAMTFEDTLDR